MLGVRKMVTQEGCVQEIVPLSMWVGKFVHKLEDGALGVRVGILALSRLNMHSSAAAFA